MSEAQTRPVAPVAVTKAGEAAEITCRPRNGMQGLGGLSVATIVRALVLILTVLTTTAANPLFFPAAGVPSQAPAAGDCQRYYTRPYVPSGPFVVE